MPSLLLATLGAALLLATPLHAQSEEAPLLERGRELTSAFYDDDLVAVAESFDPQMQQAMGEEGLRAFREQVRAELGAETAVLDESLTETGGHHVYRRSARFERLDRPMTVIWAFDAAGRVAGFAIQAEQDVPEAAPSRYLDYRTRTRLRLPFEGEWAVVWGGRTVEQNYHAAHTDQRFAYDLVVQVDGVRHRGSGEANEDYHCWGRPVLAPGAGTVVIARDGLPDNVPGQMDPAEPPGNHVVLDHGNGEYSFLAHLQEGSLRVAPGDEVTPADTLGLCGNSGNSSEPHLHYHLQDSPDFGRGEGLPAWFTDYVADGEPVERGEPVQGQRIRPAGA